MEGRIENQIKAEKKINELLQELPGIVTEYYMNFSSSKEFRSCLVYIQKIKMFLLFYIEDKKIDLKDVDFSQIKDVDIAKFLKAKEIKENNNGEISYTSFAYRNLCWSILNSFFSFLEKKRYIESNPVRLIERTKKVDNVERKFLNIDDLEKIKESINKGAGSENAIKYQKKWKTRDLAIFYTFISTGMRESALCEIDMNRIDFKNNILEVTDKEHKINTYIISEKLEKILKAWIKERKKILNGKESDALFISNRKTRITSRSVIYIINKYSDDALESKISPHKLRAAFCNIMFKKSNRDMDFTRSVMKHDNAKTTRIYLESNDRENSEKAANIMNDIL